MRKVIKRDGRSVDFNKHKIALAIEKAFEDVDGVISSEASKKGRDIADFIEGIERKLTVEDIQDIVEEKLMASKRKDVAKQYILYRNERTKTRERNGLLFQSMKRRMDATNIENSNANVDERSFSGKEKEASGDAQKLMAIELGGMSDDVAAAHKEMLIYQHDLDKALLGEHNCLQINFNEVFKYGFETRNGDVRPPSSFSTACQLVAVAFQCQSQVQFGGVGTIHLDYDLAPFVKESFRKHYHVGIEYLEKSRVRGILSPELSIEDERYKNWYPKAYKYAMDMLEKEGSQAAEGLFHNLNTLESRQGSQVPFTSINLGRDTSPEGRLVTKWVMKASIAGIGKHSLTSIFPISIYQYKKGVNANPEDPNYDLKKLALESMSKRIYPNWCNCDWSQAHEVDGEIDTMFSTMGK